LFHVAIMESGVNYGLTMYMNQTEYNDQWEEFSGAAGCNRDINCMRNLTWQELVDRTPSWSLMSWGLRIDGVEINEKPEIAVKEGRFTYVPVIIGSNRDEFPALPFQDNMTPEEYSLYLRLTYGEQYEVEFSDQLEEIYSIGPNGKYPSSWFALQHIITHQSFTCGARKHSRYMSMYTDVYHYEFHHPMYPVRANAPQFGVCHASEMIYTLRYRPLLVEPSDITVCNAAVGYWTRMSTNHNPNEIGFVQWQPFEAGDEEKTLLFKPLLEMVTNLHKDECDLWDTVLSLEAAGTIYQNKKMNTYLSLLYRSVALATLPDIVAF